MRIPCCVRLKTKENPRELYKRALDYETRTTTRTRFSQYSVSLTREPALFYIPWVPEVFSRVRRGASGSTLIFWITNPFGLVGINFTNQIMKFITDPRICSWKSNILTIESSANKWGELMYGWYNVWMDWFKLHDDLQNEIHRRFNAHLHFPFSYVTRGAGRRRGDSP